MQELPAVLFGRKDCGVTTTEQQVREARRWAGTIASGYGARLVKSLADALAVQQDALQYIATYANYGDDTASRLGHIARDALEEKKP